MASAVIRRGAQGDRWKAELPDGSSFFIPPDLVLEFRLHAGMELDQETLESLCNRCEEYALRSKALELLSRREHSRKELKIKLLQRKLDPDIIDRILDDMEASGYLDDRRFASLWISQRLRKKPEGMLKLSAALASKGVSREVIQEVLQDVDTDEALSRAAEALSRRSGMTDEKLISALMRRGFTYPQVKAWLMRAR